MRNNRPAAAKREPVAVLPIPRAVQILAGLTPPTEPFSPQAAWSLRYRLVSGKVSKGPRAKELFTGHLLLDRKPTGGGCTLTATQRLGQNDGSSYDVTASIDSAPDPLSTPRSWTLESINLDATGAKVEGTAWSEAGEVTADGILRHGLRDRKLPKPAAFTTNWNLFEALPRLGEGSLPGFTMLEELQLAKAEQSIRPLTELAFETAAGKVTLRGYQHVGRGLLPAVWWLDSAGRVIAWIGVERAWLYDPSAGRQP